MLRFIQLITAIGLVWVIGLGVYIYALPDRVAAYREIAQAQAAADTGASLGVAVLTGGGGKRIRDAMGVFSQGTGERLLISGVHEDTRRAILQQFWTGDRARFDCCVDLGPTAKSTRGNAREISAWAAQHGFSHLIIVTSEFHMPRAMGEIGARVQDATLLALPTPSGYLNEAGWPKDIKAVKDLGKEYTKYLISKLTTISARVGS